MRIRAGLLIVLAAVGALVPPGPAPARAAAPGPQVRGPIGDAGLWGHALWESWYSLDDLGYEEAEYFISGTATSDDGTSRAPFTTRIIVARPTTRQRFNGTVLLDWVNVTAQFENAVDTVNAHEMLVREGFAFVHVSAQAAGLCCTPLTPKVWDPIRYADLSHPGDDYAADIFTQVARAIRSPDGIDPMAGLRVHRVLAAGQSQSASKLGRYVRDVRPRSNAIDGFLIHGGSSKVYEPGPVAPVFHLLSEAEADPQPPSTSENYALWEVAGSAHSDLWTGYHQIFGQGP